MYILSDNKICNNNIKIKQYNFVMRSDVVVEKERKCSVETILNGVDFTLKWCYGL